jgi:hypothetical protein
MGIRINKVIGYGLDDIKTKEMRIDDPRFKVDIWDDDFHNDVMSRTEVEFYEWVGDNKQSIYDISPMDFNDPDDILAFNFRKMGIEEHKKEHPDYKINCTQCRKLKKRRIYEQIDFDPEFGLDNVMVFMPFDHGGWKRYDDIIDYVEEDCGGAPRYKHISWSGIWPYSSSMIRYGDDCSFDMKIFDEQRVPDFIKSEFEKGKMSPSNYSHLTGRWDEKQDPWAKGELLDDLNNNWRCKIPGDIIAMIAYMDIFENPQEVINQLRPMLYVYWA